MARFKKGSAAAKAWGARMKRLRNSSSTSRSTKRRTKQKMAKRRKTTRRKSTSSSVMKPMAILLGGGIYGALRAKLSNLLSPVTSKVPLGDVADEAVLFAAGYFANKNFKDKTLKSVAQSAMVVEAARMGEAVSTGSIFGGSSSNGAGMSFATLG